MGDGGQGKDKHGVSMVQWLRPCFQSFHELGSNLAEFPSEIQFPQLKHGDQDDHLVKTIVMIK